MAKAPSTKPKPPIDETKEQKFLRLAQPRVANAILALRRLHALGGTGYEHSVEQRTKIFQTLQTELNSAREAMTPKEKGSTKDKASVFAF